MQINNRLNTFRKKGKEFKVVLNKKIAELEARLIKRNAILEDLLNDKKRLRSYLLRSGDTQTAGQSNYRGRANAWMNNVISYDKEHIGIEEVEEIKHLCGRIFQIEIEKKAYEILRNNLGDEDTVELTLQELLQYGFE